MNKSASSVNWVYKTYTWDIRNFSDMCGLHLSNENENLLPVEDQRKRIYNSVLEIDFVRSPVIHVGTEDDGRHSHWLILLRQGGDDDDDINVELELLKGVNDDSDSDDYDLSTPTTRDVTDCYFRYELKVIGSNGKVVVEKGSNKQLIYLKSGDTWVEPSFIKKSHLKDNLSKFLKDDTLQLKLELEILNDLKHIYKDLPPPIQSHSPSSSSSDKKKRRRDWEAELQTSQTKLAKLTLRGLWESKKGSDAVVVCGDQSFAVHKWILASASHILTATFTHEMTEGSQGRLEITDMSPVSLELLLRFIYCDIGNGKDPLWEQVEILAELLNAAEKYQIIPLKSLCLTKLCDELSLDNAAQITTLMYLFNGEDEDSALVNFVHQFVIQNIRVLKRMDGFKKKMKENPAAFAPILFQIGEGKPHDHAH